MSNHQHTLIIDGTSGISGDYDRRGPARPGRQRGAPARTARHLPVDGFTIAVTRVNKHGIDACDFDVQLAEELENHDHDMAWLYGNETAAEHTHEHEHHHHDHSEHDTSTRMTMRPMAMATRTTITPITITTVLWRTSPPSSTARS
ncbi:MAG: nickel insertion protein [Collinsella sp.]